MKSIIDKSERLLSVCEECPKRHARMREEDREPDFFTEVKPYADEVHKLIDEWAAEVLQWIEDKKPLYVHPNQIHSAEEAMKQFVVQSFYKKTGKKRFILSVNSASYTLKTVLSAVTGGEELHE